MSRVELSQFTMWSSILIATAAACWVIGFRFTFFICCLIQVSMLVQFVEAYFTKVDPTQDTTEVEPILPIV